MSKAFTSAGKLAGLLLLCLASAQAEVQVVGAYSNRVVTDVRSQGYGIQLWQEGTQYFGFFLSSSGMAEDIPLGVLEELRVDPTARTISFKAKMTIGRSTSDGETWVPTRDLYIFTGTIYPDQISGNLIHTDTLQPDR